MPILGYAGMMLYAVVIGILIRVPNILARRVGDRSGRGLAILRVCPGVVSVFGCAIFTA